MMKNIFITIFLFVLAFNYSFGQVAIEPVEQIQTDTSQVAEKGLEKSLLWEISGNELENPSFLYGTIHIIGKDDFILTDETKTSFDKSERITFEINMEEMNDLSTMFTLMSKVMMPNAMTLKDLLEEEDYVFVKEKLSELGLPGMMMGVLERIKPMFLTTFASGDMDPNGFQNGDIVSYEMEFMEMAQQMEKEMAGLETIEYQISIFDSIPLKDQAQMLVESLKAESEGSDQFKEMVDMYLNEDIEGMQEMFKKEEGGIEEYEDVLLINRNRNWIPIMRGMMKEKPTFFAVGAGHLGGENGVIRLLKHEGYTLKPLHVKETK
jgi:uncharacterized protein YbaP (TraB family)